MLERRGGDVECGVEVDGSRILLIEIRLKVNVVSDEEHGSGKDIGCSGVSIAGNVSQVFLTKFAGNPYFQYDFRSRRFVTLLVYTSNPVTQHWQAIQRVLDYLKKTMDYRLMYSGYLSVLEGYTRASWISNTEENLSTNGWVFLLGGGAIS
ncbi:hypothetical protein Tco_1077541, partial [Tanacetum coccineum]